MSQTLSQRKALRQIGRQYDHNPDHFQFRRTIDGFYPEPDATPMDRVIAIMSAVAILAFAVALVIGVSV